MPNVLQAPIILNKQPINTFEYSWNPDSNISWCLVTLQGAGGGGAGGESFPSDFSCSRAALDGGQGGEGAFCMFRFYPGLVNIVNPIVLKVGKGGMGGGASEYGKCGDTTSFGEWLHIFGGQGGTYNGTAPSGRASWRSLRGIDVLAYGPSLDLHSCSKYSLASSTGNGGGLGGSGGKGANGKIEIFWG